MLLAQSAHLGHDVSARLGVHHLRFCGFRCECGSVARLNHKEGLFRAIATLLISRRLGANSLEVACPENNEKSANMNQILNVRSTGEALAADEAPVFKYETTEPKKKETSAINVIWRAVGTLQEFAGIFLAILYSLAAFGLGTALLFYTFK